MGYLKSNNFIHSINIAFLIAIFSVDLMVPLGVAAGVAYVGVLLLSFFSKNKYFPISVAAVSTVLVIAGYILSPEGGEAWKVILNRSLSVLVVWLTFFIGKTKKSMDLRLIEHDQTLKVFQDLLQSIPDAIFVIDGKGIIIKANSSATRLFEYKEDELIGQPMELLLPKKLHKAHVSYRKEYMKSPHLRKMGRGLDLAGITKSGKSVPVDVEINPVKIGEETIIITAVRDITDWRLVQKEIENARAQAEAANIAKSRFLAAMSHEIRTPLSAISGFAEQLQKQGITELDRENYIRTIYRNSHHLAALINDILDLSKIESGARDVEIRKTHLPKEISQVQSILGMKARDKNLELRIRFETPIPESINTDPTRLRQILLNIIGNAIKFTNSGHVEVCAGFEQNEHKNTLYWRVSDTGIGVPEDKKESIFDEFSQAEASTTRRFGGSGLGLSLSRKLARMLGGDVTLESSGEGHGCCFCVTIDAGAIDKVPMVEKYSGDLDYNDDEKIEIDLNGANILVVDDGPDNQMLFSIVLSEAGANVETADNGKEGSDAIKNGSHDLVFMDMHMPVMDGYTATKQLVDSGVNIPIIALTANATSEDRKKCFDVGCVDYHSKPIDAHKLLKLAKKWYHKADHV